MQKLLTLAAALLVMALIAQTAFPPSAEGSSLAQVVEPVGQECHGSVSIELDPQGLPTGPATNNCSNPCADGCASFFFTIPGSTGSQDAAGCGCSTSGLNRCCQVILTPPSSQGGPLPWGRCGVSGCPAGDRCRAFFTPSTGVATSSCRAKLVEILD